MKVFARIFLVMMVAVSFGCQTTQGQSGGAASPASSVSSSSGINVLTAADYKRIGIKETQDLR